MSATLLIVNSHDYSGKVNQQSYSCQRKDVYTEWTDGNKIVHRVVARSRIEGSFTMTFLSQTDYAAFKADLNAVKTSGGYFPITVWVNTDKATASINAFVELSTIHRWTTEAFGGNPEVAAVTVKIVER